MYRSVKASLGVAIAAWAQRDVAAAQRLGTVTMPPFVAALVIASLVDWLITRTLTRFAIFIPKTPVMIVGYQALSWGGQVGSALAALLALASLIWIAREERRTERYPWLGAVVVGLGGLSLLFLVMPPGGWLLVYHLLVLAALLGLGRRGLRPAASLPVRLAGLLPAAVMVAGSLHQAAPTLYAALRWAGPPAWSAPVFHAGEVLVIASAGALWWAYGRGADRQTWAVAGLPALGFAAAYLAEPAMTATIVIWSNGLTLFLPWWLYAAALWLVGVTVLWSWRTGARSVAWAILLLAAAGYAPQLSSQFFFGLTALWLMMVLGQGHILRGAGRTRAARVP